MKKSEFIFFLFFLFLIACISCKKKYADGNTPTLPENPYNKIKYPNNITEPYIDSNTFVGIHKYIFTKRCAMPGCHDGAFEPDFRTVMSAYNTLVYQPVKKNDSLKSFVYRVVPYNYKKSWLHERLITGDLVLGKMPIYDSALSVRQILQIKNWINLGAKDVFGNIATVANSEPQTYGFVATIPNGMNTLRVDTIRKGNNFMPFLVPNNTMLTIWFGVYDDIETPLQLTFNKIKFSNNPTTFSASTYLNLNNVAAAIWQKSLFANNKPYYYYYTINTNNFVPGDINYFRFYTQDKSHPLPTEIPNDGLDFYIQSYFSFVVAP